MQADQALTPHLVVLSDLHLWQATDHDELWMRYRHRRFLPDDEIAALLCKLRAEIPAGQLELVLNGDIFDFDIPPVANGHTVPAPSPRSEEAAVQRLAGILDDHEVFLFALAEILVRGDRVIFVAGNHDLQLHYSRVRELLSQRILLACQRCLLTFSQHELSSQLVFSGWFYQTKSRVHVEHGNQYDPYCSVPDPLWPFCIDGQLKTNVGTLALEHLISKMGYFNPNAEDSFLLTTREYLEHWARYYFRTPRSLVGRWFLGSLRVVIEMLKAYGISGPQERTVALQSAEEAAHSTLFAQADLRSTMRLLCVDRALVTAATLVTALCCAIWLPLGIIAAIATVTLYRSLRPRAALESADLPSVSLRVARSARLIARIYGARAVLFGHTHQPAGRWEADVFYGNTGSWAPLYRDVGCTIPVEEARPFIWLREVDGQLAGGLYRFLEGQLVPPKELHAPRSNAKARRAMKVSSRSIRRSSQQPLNPPSQPASRLS